MADETNVDESSGELHAAESSVPGTKDFGAREPMSEDQKEEMAGRAPEEGQSGGSDAT
jgi:hypothetical protein